MHLSCDRSGLRRFQLAVLLTECALPAAELTVHSVPAVTAVCFLAAVRYPSAARITAGR